jgi:hypothetical protein
MGDPAESGTLDTERLLRGMTNLAEVFPPIIYVPTGPSL